MPHCSSRAFGAAGLVAAVVGFAAAPAQAVSAYDWSGFYVGGNVGGLELDTDYTANLPSPFSSFAASSGDLGIVGGIFGGFQHQFANTPYVLGIEADFQGSNATGSFAGQEQIPAGDFKITCSLTGSSSLDWQSSIRGRAGYALGRFLPYVTGGVQFGEFDFDNTVGCVAPLEAPLAPTSASYSDFLIGWTIGAGLDYAITDSIMFQVEYRYEDFGDVTENLGTSGLGTINYDPTANMVTVGAAWRF